MGDGTLGEGVVYESLNMAALWGLPIYYVLENNRYAQSTPIDLHLAGDIEKRFSAFGIPVVRIDSTDAHAIREAAQPQIEHLRDGSGPQALILDTYRFAPHSKGDDVRDPEEIERYKRLDPIPVMGERLGKEERQALEAAVQEEVEAAMEAARVAPPAAGDEITPALGPRP
jgi:TPP-dependent pyruvate/acetoin dehydrogenase alpha subunit